MAIVTKARLTVLVVLSLLAFTPSHSRAVDIHHLRLLAAQHNLTCIIVFGDSSVDPGNNNYLATAMKGNFPPYGRDFFSGRPTGRFSNGRLATDFIAEALGYINAIPGFLDRTASKIDLLHGVSFASAASGYDDLTANLSSVLPVSKQLEYFRHYKIHLRQMVGWKKAEEIIRSAVFVMSMGTNDIVLNYYFGLSRSKQFTLEQYLNFLASCMVDDVKEMHRLGAKKLVIVGVPPVGCMPLVKTLTATTKCDEAYNKAAASLNSKIKDKLRALMVPLKMKNSFVDAFGIIENAVNNPQKYGFTEAAKGCCGSGTIEYGETCKGLSACSNPSEYVFWDAVHPSERMYRIIADEALSSIGDDLFL